MGKYLTLLLAVLLPFCANAANERMTFEGVAKEGTVFSHTMEDGNIFMLTPVAGGWKISVTDNTKAKCATADYDCNDLAAVTEPLFGISMREVLGWQFINGGLNNPKNVMGRSFSLDRTFDYAPSRKSLDKVMEHDHCVHAEQQNCGEIGSLMMRGGLMKIIGYKPSPSKEGKAINLKSLWFRVTIFPAMTIARQLRP